MRLGRFPGCVLFFKPSFSYFQSVSVCGRSTEEEMRFPNALRDHGAARLSLSEEHRPHPCKAQCSQLLLGQRGFQAPEIDAAMSARRDCERRSLGRDSVWGLITDKPSRISVRAAFSPLDKQMFAQCYTAVGYWPPQSSQDPVGKTENP